MIAAVAVTLLACAALVWILAPLRWPYRDPAIGIGVSIEPTAVEEANARKRAALTAIVDLEGERAIGKLSEPDFEALRREYEAQALAALRELDTLASLPSGDFGDDEFEVEIAALRERLRCPNCGAARVPGEPCGRCGA